MDLKLTERWPFLTHIKYLNQDYIGIVQNSDQNFVHMYVIEQYMTDEQKVEFLSCGELYWWGSNRQVPINLFLGSKFKPFKLFLKSFSQKEVKHQAGPMLSMESLLGRRTKKRTIQLVKSEPVNSGD
jgi:hypothetical protein